ELGEDQTRTVRGLEPKRGEPHEASARRRRRRSRDRSPSKELAQVELAESDTPPPPTQQRARGPHLARRGAHGAALGEHRERAVHELHRVRLARQRVAGEHALAVPARTATGYPDRDPNVAFERP